jgi:hypothetical protein
MDLTPVSLVLAVSTAWATLFLGVLSPPALRLQSWEILKVCGAWMLVALTAPSSIFHWYFIFAFICLVAWIHIRRDRVLAAKIWLSVASGLGISLGVIFFIQAAPALCPADLPLRNYLLLLASIYLGGTVAGLAYAGVVLSIGALYTNRSTTTRIWATVSLLTFGTNVFARWLLM